MWFPKNKKQHQKQEQKQKQPSPATRKDKLFDLYQMLNETEDFVSRDHKLKKIMVRISYIKPMIDTVTLHREVMPFILKAEAETLEDLLNFVPFASAILTSDVKDIKEKLLKGFIYIQRNKNEPKGLLINVVEKNGRQIAGPEVEFSVLGPKESFVESIDTNLSLIRKRLPMPNFKVKSFVLGKLTKTKVSILYIEGIANEENVNTMIQRVSEVEYDQIIDSSFITQMVADNSNSPFPQLIDTERPDRVVSSLVEGKIAVLVDGSPFAIMGPTTIVEFFSAFDDYTLVWYLASFFRMIRLSSVAFSVLASPFYVAILTYHYQLIPKDLLGTLISSRMGIPFPPIAEALFLELTIEVLREAGVRLPTKVGQTIGIVGGIVIGTASVQANLTSNVLLILVAMAALASFTTPNYKMNNTVRLMRFPFLLASAAWGLFGVAACFALIVAHLLKLTSLGRPYIEPFFPFRLRDLKDAFIRLPFKDQRLRPMQLRPEDSGRLNVKRANMKKDIDE